MRDVVIVSAVRTPIGGFLGSLSTIPATQLGSIAIKGALDKIQLDPKEVQEVLMGNVLQANNGQAPARQAALGAGLSETVPCTTVNKVCSSGMKAIMQAAQAIRCGDADVIVAGGMENMSMVPHYLPNGRNGQKLGSIEMIDGLLRDGLTDVYNKTHMGNCAELCARDMNFSREEQDEFAINSYKRSADAWANGRFKDEVIPVEIPQRKGDPILVTEDEDYKKVNFEKIPQLRPVFDKEGSVTAANASNLNDGAAAMVLMSAEKAQALGLKPLARVVSYADAAQASEWFTTSPAKAVPLAIEKAGLKKEDISYYELNEAFSVVGLANMQLLGIDASQTNINGGAVSIGHPLGASGARIVVTLLNVLKQNNGKYGAAGICNGGGGASALVIESL
ncbi:MAG TPA: acetyl-CoA C-acetyltransferase [Cryomorphaceae bacterium]|nr:acetyl-CoA C-acyltransferase [Owenweeksia sp.]MBF97380.1 acetyl-CoA C-acyltransferase [Owenweeksia sp.]HAD95850.1 acetyl-CoA C-acetyltransferase [Cryomorphaceae bacterium]|tara:strand:+ start:339 stop:1517 length:1179 start_codon:yes stop_codon:yes gene_type:complete